MPHMCIYILQYSNILQYAIYRHSLLAILYCIAVVNIAIYQYIVSPLLGSTCNHPVKMHREIVNATHVLVLQMEVWSTVNGNGKPTSLPYQTVDSSTYTLMSAVSLSSSAKPGRHYMAIWALSAMMSVSKNGSFSGGLW